MVIQKKGGVQGKQKSKGQFKLSAPQKVFQFGEENASGDEDDFDSSDVGSDVESVEEMPSKTPDKSVSTPGQGKKKEMHVSFQLQNKKTPLSSQQKVAKGTPVPSKKTPLLKQESNFSGKKGKTSLKEFGGMNNSFGAKIERISPPKKGKMPEGSSSVKTTVLKKSKQEKRTILKRKAGDDDDDDDDESDDFDDDDDMEDDSGEEDGNDEDVDDEDDDDDDFEDDIDELGSEEEREIRETILAVKGNNEAKRNTASQKNVNKKTPQKGPQQVMQCVQKTPKAKNVETPEKGKQTPNSKKAVKTLLKKEEPIQQQTSVEGDKSFQQSLALEKQRERERDARNLFIRGVPIDATIEELKSLSPDILDVTLPKAKYQRKNRKVKNFFAFLEFANEKKAEENYTLLQNKKLRGQPIFVDFSGEKSKNRSVAGAQNKEVQQKNYDKKKLFVSGLTTDTTINQVAELFPKAFNITLNNSPEFRNAMVGFRTEEAAAEAFASNASAKINGRLLTVLYSLEGGKSKKKNKRPRQQQQQKNKSVEPPAKKLKTEPKVEVEEEDDDDEEEEE